MWIVMRRQDYRAMVLRYVVRYTFGKKLHKRKGNFGFAGTRKLGFSQETNTFPDENSSARYATRRYLSMYVSRRVMHFFVCAFYIYIYTLIYPLRTQKCIRWELDLSFFQLIIHVPFIYFQIPKWFVYRLSFAANSLIALITF